MTIPVASLKEYDQRVRAGMAEFRFDIEASYKIQEADERRNGNRWKMYPGHDQWEFPGYPL
jgi:hypothetical protein